MAVEGNHEACVRALLRAGASLTLEDDDLPPVLRAAFDSRAPILRIFLEAGVDPTAEYGGGWTLLHRVMSTRPGSAECVKLLLAAGADVNALCRSSTGNMYTPLDLAMSSEYQLRGMGRIYPLLLRAGATFPTPHSNSFLTQYREPYLAKILAAGSFAAYEKRHVDALTATLAPKITNRATKRTTRTAASRSTTPRIALPTEVVRVIVTFWAHCGYY